MCAVSFLGVFQSISQFRPVSNVYKTLGVGVCSCVYSACPEIVTELCKQFTVNKLFLYSNKGPMRLNCVPRWPTSTSHEREKNKIKKTLQSRANQSTQQQRRFYYHFRSIRPSPPKDSTHSTISLGPGMCRRMLLWGDREHEFARGMSFSWNAS